MYHFFGETMYELHEIYYEFQIKGFHSINYFELGKHFSHPAEKHSFWEFVYVDMGQAVALVDGVGYALEQGQIIFHEPGELHAHMSNNETANNLLVVTFSVEGDIMKTFKKKTFTLDKAAKKLLQLFMQECRHSVGNMTKSFENQSVLNFHPTQIGTSQLLYCYLSEFFIYLLRNSGNFEKANPLNQKASIISDDSLAELIKQYLKDNVYANLSLKDICDHFVIGKSQLYQLFEENTDTTPIKYYTRQKIAEAKKLLREGTHSVSQISDLLGYTTVHNFSRAFKNETNFSPLEYKKSIM